MSKVQGILDIKLVGKLNRDEFSDTVTAYVFLIFFDLSYSSQF